MSLEQEIKDFLNSQYNTKNIRADYTTNTQSYYDYIEKVTGILVFMSKKIDEYDGILSSELQNLKNTLDEYLEKWDENLEKFDESVLILLQEWMDDGTFEHIINHEIFNTKADKTDLDETNKKIDLMGYMINKNTSKDMIDHINDVIHSAYLGGGGNVFFPSGVYIVEPTWEKNIIMRDNVNLIGTGNSVIKVSDNNENFDALITGIGSKVQNVKFEGMTFDTNSENNQQNVGLVAGRRMVLYWQLANNIIINNCKFYHSGINCIYTTGAMYNHKNIFITNNYFKFTTQGTSQYDNTCMYIGQIGHVITGNVIEGMFNPDFLKARAVTAIESHSSYAIIEDNIITEYASGVLVLGADYGMTDVIDKSLVQKNISNNILRKMQNGITLWAGNRDVNHVNIVNNVIDINNADRNRPAQNVYGIALSHRMGGSRMMETITDVLISNNNIKFQAPSEWLTNETTDESGIYMGAFGIGSFGNTVDTVTLRNIVIINNTITNAPRQVFTFACESGKENQYKDIIIKGNTIYNPMTQIRTDIEYRTILLLFGKITNLIMTDNIIIDTRSTTPIVKEVHMRSLLANFKDITILNNHYQTTNKIGLAKNLPIFSRPSSMVVFSENINKIRTGESLNTFDNETFDVNEGYIIRTPSSTQTNIAICSKEGTRKTLTTPLTGTYEGNVITLPNNIPLPFKPGECILLKNMQNDEVLYNTIRIIAIDYIGFKLIVSLTHNTLTNVSIQYSQPNFVSINTL